MKKKGSRRQEKRDEIHQVKGKDGKLKLKKLEITIENIRKLKNVKTARGKMKRSVYYVAKMNTYAKLR